MKLRPLNNYVIMQPVSAPETRTPSGIIIPASVEDKQIRRSVIISTSTACTQTSADDSVLSRPGDGTPFKFEAQELIAIDERALIAKIEKE